MVQIIRPQPYQPSRRERAMKESTNQIIAGLGNFGKAYTEKKKTERQLAMLERADRMDNFKTALSWQKESGETVSPDQIALYKETGRLNPELGEGEFGPEAPSGLESILEGVKVRQDTQRKQKTDKAKLDADYLKARTVDLQGKAERTRVKAEALRTEKKRVEDRVDAKEKKQSIREREVSGRGMIRTKKEAQDLRKADTAMKEAVGIINRMKKLGTNISVMDRTKIGKINSAKSILAGKLRLPLTGPGILTEKEFDRLIDNMGDPSTLFSTEKKEFAKMDQLQSILEEQIELFYQSVRDPNAEGSDAVNNQQSAPARMSPEKQRRLQEVDARIERLKAKQAQGQ